MLAKRIVRILRRATGWPRRTGTPDQTALPAHLHALLGWRLTGLALNPKDIERHSPLVMDQLRSRCALCEHKRRCLEGMMDYRNPPGWEGYCPNATAIHSIGSSGSWPGRVFAFAARHTREPGSSLS
jgi:hypothetical protein